MHPVHVPPKVLHDFTEFPHLTPQGMDRVVKRFHLSLRMKRCWPHPGMHLMLQLLSLVPGLLCMFMQPGGVQIFRSQVEVVDATLDAFRPGLPVRGFEAMYL
jgi:hypothetical protein